MTRVQMILLIVGLVILVSLAGVAYFVRHAEDDPFDRDAEKELWRRRR